MKTHHPKKALTFGKFIASVYDVCGGQKAKGTVRRAVNEHWVEFLGKKRFKIF